MKRDRSQAEQDQAPRHSHLKVFTDVSRSGDGEQSKDKSKTMLII
jgi:hypothetical protein